jgi:hypothetical protein
VRIIEPSWVARAEDGQIVGHLRAVHGEKRNGLNTATSATSAFYQRCGLRMGRVVQGAFVPATGYPDPIEIDGIPLRDQVWFGLELCAHRRKLMGDL